MSDPKLQALITRATTALKGKPPWGHTLSVNFGDDGALFVYANNAVVEGFYGGAECALKLNGIATLEDLESKRESPTEEWWHGNLSWEGDRSVAEAFVAILTGGAN